jgi:hypothetical protein
MNIGFAALLAVGLFGTVAEASSIRQGCSNLDATIQINFTERKITILEYPKPRKTYAKFTIDEIETKETLIREMPSERRGNTSRELRFVKIRLRMMDDSPVPNAYNRNTDDDGTLTDYFICATDRSWMGR